MTVQTAFARYLTLIAVLCYLYPYPEIRYAEKLRRVSVQRQIREIKYLQDYENQIL